MALCQKQMMGGERQSWEHLERLQYEQICFICVMFKWFWSFMIGLISQKGATFGIQGQILSFCKEF